MQLISQFPQRTCKSRAPLLSYNILIPGVLHARERARVQASSPTCLTLRRTVKRASECFGKRARELGNLYASRTSLSLKSVFKKSSKAGLHFVNIFSQVNLHCSNIYIYIYKAERVVLFSSGYEAACHGTKVLFRSAKYIKQDQLSQVT